MTLKRSILLVFAFLLMLVGYTEFHSKQSLATSPEANKSWVLKN